jgi:hypothetical protein
MNFVEFKDGERTFTCEAKSSPATPGTVWWWMSVTGESQRYAAFHVEATDTQANLQKRILAYYTQLLVDRARPREIRGQWGRRPAAPAAPAVADATSGMAESAEAVEDATRTKLR